ncbi:MAG: hypothetical protein WC989_02990 [Micavibrio sp.]
MRPYKIFLLLSGTIALGAGLGGCASIIDTPTQPVTVVTTGASEAYCILDNGIRYRVHNGQTVKIQRSRKALQMDCYAAGNRHINHTIESGLNETASWNVTNAVVPGVAYDAVSGGLFAYPEKITIDFSGMAPRGYELPSYHNKDAPNPYEQSLESYAPSKPRLDSERGLEPETVKRLDSRASSNPFDIPGRFDGARPPGTLGNGQTQGGHMQGVQGNGVTVMPPAAGAPRVVPSAPQFAPAPVPAPVLVPTLKGDTAEELTRSMNPSVFSR